MRDLPHHLRVPVTPDAAPRIDILSGMGEKGPACLRLWTGHQTWILDAGFGPEASSPFRPEWLAGADRVFITHDHVDHVGGAAHAISAGLPIHCTAMTALALPPGADLHLLPTAGQVDVDGITLTVGRNGHALGGVWLHFALGAGGIFYSGDWCAESDWFALDMPPPADLAFIDASYHLEGVSQDARKAALDAALAGLFPEVQVLFPVPPSGRAAELALHLSRLGSVSMDETCRRACAAALDSGDVAPGAQAARALVDAPFDPSARFLLCDTPNADGGMAWTLVQDWRASGRLGRDAVVFFTGHMTAHARAIAAHGGRFLRWNVHPTLACQRAMLDHLGARRFAPLFCSTPEEYLLEDLGGRQVILGSQVMP